jgi:hypothetical protein
LEGLFDFLKGGRGFIVLHREIVDFKAEVFLNLVKIAILSTEIDNAVNALIANRPQFVIGHGRMAHSQLIGDPG